MSDNTAATIMVCAMIAYCAWIAWWDRDRRPR